MRVPRWVNIYDMLVGFAVIGLFILIVMGIVVAFAEWAAGCGETFVDSKGIVHNYECIFIGDHK